MKVLQGDVKSADIMKRVEEETFRNINDDEQYGPEFEKYKYDKEGWGTINTYTADQEQVGKMKIVRVMSKEDKEYADHYFNFLEW